MYYISYHENKGENDANLRRDHYSYSIIILAYSSNGSDY